MRHCCGAYFPWREIQQDFTAQRVADRAHRIRASYHLVTDRIENDQRILRRLAVLRRRGEAGFEARVFEFSRHYGSLRRLHPDLDHFLEVLTGSSSRVRNKTAFAHIQLAWTGSRRCNLLGLLSSAAAETGFVRLPGRPLRHLEQVVLSIRGHGLVADEVGGRLRVEFSGFTATFDVPCSERVLNEIREFLDQDELDELDVLEWFLSQGY